jgi:hypothetical protein
MDRSYPDMTRAEEQMNTLRLVIANQKGNASQSQRGKPTKKQERKMQSCHERCSWLTSSALGNLNTV